MPFIPTARCVEVKLLMSQNSVPNVNRWYFDVGHAVALLDLTDLATMLDTWITAWYAAQITNQLAFEQIIVTDVSIANGQQIIQIPTTTTGAATGAAAAANAAAVASLRTASTGRNFRGRTYVPGLVAGHLASATHMTTGHATGINAAFNQLALAAIGLGYKLVVLSRWLNNVLRVAGLMTEIITVITDTKIDSQRRRTAN